MVLCFYPSDRKERVMKNKSSIVFTGDIGFDRFMYGKWNDEELISHN